jgi:hypothetical protein
MTYAVSAAATGKVCQSDWRQNTDDETLKRLPLLPCKFPGGETVRCWPKGSPGLLLFLVVEQSELRSFCNGNGMISVLLDRYDVGEEKSVALDGLANLNGNGPAEHRTIDDHRVKLAVLGA